MLIVSCHSDHLGKNTYFLLSLKGQERYGNMTRVYYKEAVGALVVFDMTRLSTFQAVLKWKGDLDSKVNLEGGLLQQIKVWCWWRDFFYVFCG